MPNRVLSPEARVTIKVATPACLAVVVFPVTVFFPQVFLLAAFLVFQFLLRLAVYRNNRTITEVPFLERVIGGPAKFATAALMVNVMPAESSVFSTLWIGCACWFLYSGAKDLYSILRADAKERPAPVSITSAWQQKKASLIEDRLLTEISEFLAGKDKNEDS